MKEKFYKERTELALSKVLNINFPTEKFESVLKEHHLKLLPGRFNSQMPEYYIMAPVPPDYNLNLWPYPSMIVDEDFNLENPS